MIIISIVYKAKGYDQFHLDMREITSKIIF